MTACNCHRQLHDCDERQGCRLLATVKRHIERTVPPQPAQQEPMATAITSRHYHEYEGSAKDDTVGYLVTKVVWRQEPTVEGKLQLYAAPAPQPAQQERTCSTCKHHGDAANYDETCWTCSKFYSDKWEALHEQS